MLKDLSRFKIKSDRTMKRSFKKKMENGNILVLTLYVLGIPVVNKQKQRKTLRIIHMLSLIFGQFFTLYSLATYVFDLANFCDNLSCSKMVLSLMIWEISLIMNRYSIYSKRIQIKGLLESFENIQRVYKYKLGKNMIIINVLTIVFLTFSVTYLGLIMLCFFVDRNESEEWFDDLTFNSNITVSFPIKVSFNIIYIVSTRLFRLVTPQFLTIFYIQWCLILNRLVKQCIEELRISFHTSNKHCIIQHFMRNYSVLHELHLMVESALSMEIFWLMASHFIIVFAMLSKVLGFFGYFDLILDIENTIFFFLDTISLFSIIFFASRVNKEDERIRDKVKDIAFHLSLVKETKETSKLLIRYIQSKRHLVLTAWGIFQFKKNFLFTSVGVLITYNLLILQLNTPSAQEK
ncbi:uncharacterized protein CDAR_416061 [Caerostris darwini]|uniref:Gustatory receptor n=1 Tax=Caerostris darwini TaxID=1538125 RepID=A0AAV4UMC0_9ARAC|nr:uncharacterized protein CDAR_416061 [Caerostris darwini]